MRHLTTQSILFIFLLCLPVTAFSCGYSFIGGCPTEMYLKINGTFDDFYVQPCSFGKNFNDLELGLLQSLHLAGGKAVTWESCINNVTDVRLRYRVYPRGQAGSAWQQISLQQDSFGIEGPYTTRHRSLLTDIDVCNGLTPGLNYVLEVYYEAVIDTIGDDFIPETTLLQNNNGKNYHLYFQYGGPTAPPFVVIPTHVEGVACYGDTTGTATISVYGDKTGIFYAWSGKKNNFYIINNLSGGPQVVTVTNASGYSVTDTIYIPEPQQLTAEIHVPDIGCDGGHVLATAVIGGGRPPYRFRWDGQPSDSVTQLYTEPGLHYFTLLDSNNCTLRVDFEVKSNQTLNEIVLSAAICKGDVYTVNTSSGPIEFTQSGSYTIIQSGQMGACDTVYALQLFVVQPFFEQLLPDTLHLNCETPSVEICLPYQSLYTYSWQHLADSCSLVTGTIDRLYYSIVEHYSGEECSAADSIIVQSAFSTPGLKLTVQNAQGPLTADGAVAAQADAGFEPYTYIWNTADTVQVLIDLLPGIYCVTVVDAAGCMADTCATVDYTLAVKTPEQTALHYFPNPVNAGSELRIKREQAARNARVRLLDSEGREWISAQWPAGMESLSVPVSENLAAGAFFLKIETDYEAPVIRLIFVNK